MGDPVDATPAASSAGQKPRQNNKTDKNASKPKEPGHYPDMNEIWMLDYIRNNTHANTWYYKDRCGVTRGPAPLPVLREAWVQGVVDETTLVWGQGLGSFIPIRNVRTLVPQIRIPEVRAATFIKKHLAIKPAYARARKERGDARQWESSQVNNMY